MRILLAAALLALGACGQSNTATQNADGCARSATHEVAWSSEGVADTIITRADGPTCLQAVVTFVARDSTGNPLWSFASTYHDMTAGGAAPEDAPAVTNAQMDAFLTSWADVTQMNSNELPQWREGVATLTESATTFAYDTPFDRNTYEMLRARNLPMICYAAAAEATQCLLIDPTSHSPTMIVAYGP